MWRQQNSERSGRALGGRGVPFGFACLLAAGCGGGGGSAGSSLPLDAAPPLLFAEPASGRDDLGPAALFLLDFDGTLAAASLEGRVTLTAAGRIVPVRLHAVGGGRLLVDPAVQLPSDTDLRLLLEAGISTDLQVLDRPVELRFRTAPGGARPELRFDPLGGELRPFPSDFYTSADESRPSGRRIEIRTVHVPNFVGLEVEGEMDGFDPSSRVMLASTDPVDVGSVPTPAGSTDPAASVLLFRADPAHPDFALPVAFLAKPETLGLSLDPPDPLLMLRPLAPLEAGTRYAVVVTRRVRGQDGAPFGPSTEMQRLLSGEQLAPRLEDYGRLVREVLEAASARLPFGVEDVAGITVFTTASEEALTGRLATIAERLIRTAEIRPPRFRVDSVEQQGDLVRVFGRMTSYEFRGPAQTFEAARFESVPLPAPVVELEVVLTLPAGVQGAPVVLYGHGINDRKENDQGMVPELAERGIASVAIDLVEHGSRFTGQTIPALSFLSLDFLPGMRDNARQSILDLLQLARLAERDLDGLDVLPVGDPDGVPDVDGSRMGFLGISFGAIHGAMLTALEPNFRVSALVVGGGAWTDVAFEFPALSVGNDGFDGLGAIAAALDLPIGEVFTLISVAQQVLAPGDPLTYARRILKNPFSIARTDRSILQIEVMDDNTVPNLANESLARALGLPLLEPSRRPVPGLRREAYPARANGPRATTLGLVQFERFEDGRVATHNNVLSADDTRDLVADFIADALAGRVPRIEEPLPQRSEARP